MVHTQEATPGRDSSNSGGVRPSPPPDDPPLARWFAIFILLNAVLSYVVLLFVRERPLIGAKDVFGGLTPTFGAKLGLGIAGLLVWVLAAMCTYYAYKHCFRKPLLARHRLYRLAGHVRSGSGFLELAMPGIACFVIAMFVLGTTCRGTDCPAGSAIAIHLLILLATLAISVWVLHLVDYFRVTAYLSANQTRGLGKTIEWLAGTLQLRLKERKSFMENIYQDHKDSIPIDDLPDREMFPELLETLLSRLSGQVKTLEDDDPLLRLRALYGNIVALFHPDYLPHLAHVYLKISQLRALNMAPRRIQLLGRRWTVRGLESEYVVVHDISELRSEYVEWPEMATRTAKIRNLLTDRAGIPPSSTVNPAQPAVVAEPVQKHSDFLRDLLEPAGETKWKQRSLKKRAVVTVAPDGSLLGISIEEERQFNI